MSRLSRGCLILSRLVSRCLVCLTAVSSVSRQAYIVSRHCELVSRQSWLLRVTMIAWRRSCFWCSNRSDFSLESKLHAAWCIRSCCALAYGNSSIHCNGAWLSHTSTVVVTVGWCSTVVVTVGWCMYEVKIKMRLMCVCVCIAILPTCRSGGRKRAVFEFGCATRCYLINYNCLLPTVATSGTVEPGTSRCRYVGLSRVCLVAVSSVSWLSRLSRGCLVCLVLSRLVSRQAYIVSSVSRQTNSNLAER
jgi:hypothetical protein